MKIFINTTNWTIVKQENEYPILVGNNYVDELKVYYDSNPSTQYFYPTLNILKPNNRKVGSIQIDATSVEEPNPSTYTDDDNNTWYMFKFTLSSDNHQIDVSGKYQFTIVTNYYNSSTGVILKQRNINTILSVVNAVTNDNNRVVIYGDDPSQVVDELYSLCQSLQTGVASLQISVSALQNGKADLNNDNQDIVAFSITVENAYIEDIISNSGASITMDSALGGISFKPVGSNKTITIGAGQIKGIDTVSNNTDAANKQYVDNGLNTKADRNNNAQTITAGAIYVGEINDSTNTSQIEPVLLGINFNVKPNESAQYTTFELYSTGFYGFNTTPTRNDQLVNKAYADTKGNKIDLEIDSDFKLVAKLYNGTTLLSTSTVVDLPLESVVVSGEYDATNKKVILTLQDGSTIEFSVADLISGLQSEINANNKLSSDYVDDTTAANKFVSQQEKNQITANKNAIEEIEGAIPTKTSDLTNDSGFIDETYHDNTKQDVLSGSESIDITSNVVSVKDSYKDSIIQESKDYTDKSIKDLLFYIGGKTIEEQTDNTIAYEKTIPNGALKFAELGKLGFMSYKAINLFDKSTVNMGYILNGGNLQESGQYMTSDYIEVQPNEIYTICVADVGFNVAFYTENKTTISQNVYTNTFTPTSSTKYIRISAFKTRLDTFMIVKGTKVPSSYVDYVGNFEGIRDSVITSIESKDSNDNTIDTFTIPNQVIAMANYGKGINENCYNYVLFTEDENGQFKVYYLEDVGDLDLSSVNWTISANRYVGNVPNDMKLYDDNTMPIWLCEKYKPIKAVDSLTTNKDGIAQYQGIRLYYESGVPMPSGHLLYQKATTTITDITEYFTDNYIEVEANGSLVANNEYQQAVPSEITYLVEVNNND